ncbi:transmembrane emp24 domain-containing protein 5 [Manduca sexta]|uniref:transmembrane emp24 domain-containing protein 5 n=1 Tax=Manduca sexta TaxID=7130 RepID=UPI00188E4B0B|nr:transmembrane emp24 domain-containing protein 5 [Manduca sexta]
MSYRATIALLEILNLILKMNLIRIVASLLIIIVQCNAVTIYESDVNFRIDPGSRTCFFEKGTTGHTMEVYYQVLDGQHGDFDISFDIIDPNGVKIISDYKKPQNSIILELEVEGDYAFCMDNSFSIINSKLVFISVVIEPPEESTARETNVFVDDEGKERVVEEVLQWMGSDNDGTPYYIDIERIADSLSRTLKHVVKARQLLDIYGALKSRDTYLAFEDTLIVDLWSGFQITIMCLVGMLQVYVIKKLFNTKSYK